MAGRKNIIDVKFIIQGTSRVLGIQVSRVSGLDLILFTIKVWEVVYKMMGSKTELVKDVVDADWCIPEHEATSEVNSRDIEFHHSDDVKYILEQLALLEVQIWEVVEYENISYARLVLTPDVVRRMLEEMVSALVEDTEFKMDIPKWFLEG